jgi:hypothetical protein
VQVNVEAEVAAEALHDRDKYEPESVRAPPRQAKPEPTRTPASRKQLISPRASRSPGPGPWSWRARPGCRTNQAA